jgi:NAD(P)-dependent dehydrogenase (short-subunit alcohol dehydrogenase family)
MRVAITGSNRGIGLELVKQCLERGDMVFAGAREPAEARALQALKATHAGELVIGACDVADEASVRSWAEGIPAPLDALINNAGVYTRASGLAETDLDEALKVYDINALGPLRVTRALLPQLRSGKGKRILHVTSGMGSIEDNSSGGSYGYRMSKAALNMASKSLSVELKGEGIASAVINPGWVRTDMGGPSAPTEVETSARGILKQLDGLDLDSSGEFLDYAGKRWPW